MTDESQLQLDEYNLVEKLTLDEYEKLKHNFIDEN